MLNAERVEAVEAVVLAEAGRFGGFRADGVGDVDIVWELAYFLGTFSDAERLIADWGRLSSDPGKTIWGVDEERSE